MKKILCAMLVAGALTIIPATTALAADPIIEQPTVTTDFVKGNEVVSVEGLSVELETIWGTNGTNVVSVTGPSIAVFEVPLFHPVVEFDDPIIAVEHYSGIFK